MDRVHTFMQYGSRLVIIVAVFAIVLSIPSLMNRRVEEYRAQQEKKTFAPAASASANIATSVEMKKVSFNLKGPLICKFTEGKTSTSAYVKNRNISVSYADGTGTTKAVLTSGCLYVWGGEAGAIKTCGLEQYVSLFETLSSFGIVDLQTIFNAAPVKSSADTKEYMQAANKLQQSCVAETVSDEMFTVPQGVVFKEKSL